MRIQYVGFSVVAAGREYSFRVAGEDNEERSVTVTIENANFLPGKLKYQEGPDISYRKLLSALATEQSAGPTAPRQQVTRSEVTEYTAAGSSKARAWTEEQRLAARQRFRARAH